MYESRSRQRKIHLTRAVLEIDVGVVDTQRLGLERLRSRAGSSIPNRPDLLCEELKAAVARRQASRLAPRSRSPIVHGIAS